MSWYYADKNERRGPVDDAALASLVAAGTITSETLVWREGMADWQPYRQAAPPPSTAVAPGTEMGVCSESGKLFPRSELIEIDGRLVSAEYKNVVLQRLREGVAASGEAANPEQLGQLIAERDYTLSIRACIGRGWQLIKTRFWLCFGAVFLTMMISQAAGMIPLLGPVIVFGPLTAGIYWMMIRMRRGEPAGIGDVFVGFSQSFGHLLGYSAVLFGAIFACIIPAGIVFGIATVMNQTNPSVALIVVAALLGFVGFAAMMYFWTAWIFGLPLIIDKKLDFWPAMKLSRRVVDLHWWKIFFLIVCTGLVVGGVMIVAMLLLGIAFALLSAAGIGEGVMVASIVLFAGVFIFLLLTLMPLSYAAIVEAYEEIFRRETKR